jgi:peptidoglycan-associated lipoprotein
MIRVRGYACAFTLSTAVAIAAAGCAKKVPQQPVAPPPSAPPSAAPTRPPPPPPPPAPPPPARAPVTLTEGEIFARKSLDQVNAEKPLGDAYFDLDKSEIREDGRHTLQQNADWLKKWASTRVSIEGHCDSRGSSEYNLALGDRRASAVKAYLVDLGIPANRLLTVSKGKEEPVCRDETESCWQQNRRGHFIVTAK